MKKYLYKKISILIILLFCLISCEDRIVEIRESIIDEAEHSFKKNYPDAKIQTVEIKKGVYIIFPEVKLKDIKGHSAILSYDAYEDGECYHIRNGQYYVDKNIDESSQLTQCDIFLYDSAWFGHDFHIFPKIVQDAEYAKVIKYNRNGVINLKNTAATALGVIVGFIAGAITGDDYDMIENTLDAASTCETIVLIFPSALQETIGQLNLLDMYNQQ